MVHLVKESKEQTPSLVIIDGFNNIFRAYYGVPFLSTLDGFPTNAIYGFVTMLQKVIDDFTPTHIAIAFDSKGPTFRKEMFSDYKKQRKEMPVDLVPQIPKIKEVVDAFNITSFAVPGYEADDIIATLVQLASPMQIFIISGDKDLSQVVDYNVKLVDTLRGKVTGVDEVKERFGVTPEKIIDIFGLMGDRVDNIPGVPGIGEKIAVKLISEFGSLEEVLLNVNKVKGTKCREKLTQYADQARLSKKLACVKRNVPLEFENGIDDLYRRSPNKKVLFTLFKEFEFSSFLRKFD